MIETLLSRLEKVKPRGRGKYMALCPAHEDRTPSLGIVEADNGIILMKCYAGCEVSDVMAAIGLSLGDLYPDNNFRQVHAYRGFQQMENDYKQKQSEKKQENLESDKIFLAICESSRERGEKQPPDILEKERQAYMRVRNAHDH